MSVIINFGLIFSGSIVRCCVWYISLSRNKIIIHSRILCYLSRPKSLANSILNIYNIIRSEDGFRVNFFT